MIKTSMIEFECLVKNWNDLFTLKSFLYSLKCFKIQIVIIIWKMISFLASHILKSGWQLLRVIGLKVSNVGLTKYRDYIKLYCKFNIKYQIFSNIVMLQKIITYYMHSLGYHPLLLLNKYRSVNVFFWITEYFYLTYWVIISWEFIFSKILFILVQVR